MYQVKTVQRVGAMMFLWGSFAYLAFQIHVPNFGGISAGICLPCIFLLHHLGLVVANVGSSRRSLASRCLSSEKLGDQSSWTLFANAYSGAGEFHWFDPGRCRVREGQLSRIQCICICEEAAELQRMGVGGGHLTWSSRLLDWDLRLGPAKIIQNLQHRQQPAKEEKKCRPCAMSRRREWRGDLWRIQP